MVTKALKGPSLLADQEEFTQSDNDDHRGLQTRFSFENPSFVDCETNSVDEKCFREYRTYFCIPKEIIFRLPENHAAWNPPQGTYTDQPRLSKHEGDRVAQAVQTSMESRNFKALVTAGSLKAFSLIPELINDLLDLDPILGKMILALKSAKVISKEDTKTAEKQGIAPPDDPSLAEDYDNEGLNLNTATAGSGVVATVSTAGSDAPVRALSSSELIGSEPIDSIFRDLGPIPEWEASKIATDGSSEKIRKDTASVLPEQIVVPKVGRPSAMLSGFFGGEGSARQAPAEAIGSLLSELDRLDPSVALHWAMTGELSFGSTEDFEAFNAGSMVDQGQKSLHFLTMLLRKCDLAVKDKRNLPGNQGSALAVEKMKNEESARRIAALEKQRDSLEFRLKDYELIFETTKVKLGVRAIDLFKHSPAFEAFTHKEFMRGVKACKTLVRSLDHPTLADQIDESLRVNAQEAEENLKKQIAR
ncbi:hypothetical protein LWI29_013306 [Acer saccharum]|uniref:Uncharacterized protein n=1 Tax=Acer saccharum TaxID=4024 RepID=A0AA39VAZ6_ACESA|nr:hypothetical protein LWI29_013306 [Acer saccharum]